jgi:hypothetical protein
MKGIRFLKCGLVVKVFTDHDWKERARDVAPGTYDTIQGLKPGAFDTWVVIPRVPQ